MALQAKFFASVRELLAEEQVKTDLEKKRGQLEDAIKKNKSQLIRVKGDILEHLAGVPNVVVVPVDGKIYLIDPHRTASDEQFIRQADMAEQKDKGK